MSTNFCRPKFSFGHFAIYAFFVFAKRVYERLLNNVNFPSVQAMLPGLLTHIQAYDNAIQEAMSRDTEKIADRNDKREVLESYLRDAAILVMAASTKREILATSGFELVEGRGPVEPVGQVEGVKFSFEPGVSGLVKLRWKRSSAKDAASFVIEQTTGDPSDPATEWKVASISKKCSCEIANLTPGEVYSFRVYGIGALGPGGKSEPVSTVVL